jgi:hypothetical protein
MTYRLVTARPGKLFENQNLDNADCPDPSTWTSLASRQVQQRSHDCRE